VHIVLGVQVVGQSVAGDAGADDGDLHDVGLSLCRR
jgi:hypothetical protein